MKWPFVMTYRHIGFAIGWCIGFVAIGAIMIYSIAMSEPSLQEVGYEIPLKIIGSLIVGGVAIAMGIAPFLGGRHSEGNLP